MTIGAYVTSTMGMHSQSHSLQQISMNVANVTTTGYKKVDPRFETFMTVYNEIGSDSHYFSAANVDRRMVNIAGQQSNTSSIYDVAITGDGFFMVTGDKQSYLTRAGNFTTTVVPPEGYPQRTVTFNRPAATGVVTQTNAVSYLTTPDGCYVMGWNYNPETETFSGDLEPITITPEEYTDGHQTTRLALTGNIPSNAQETKLLKFGVYDNEFKQHSFTTAWTKSENKPDSWIVDFSMEDGAVTSGSIEVSFDDRGNLISPIPNTVVSVDWGNGQAGSITMDLREITQFSTVLTGAIKSQDGKGWGGLMNMEWDQNGVLNAKFTNGANIPVCKLAIAKVPSPNLLEAASGNMFAYTTEAGEAEVFDLEHTRTETQIAGGWLENSNVSLEEEFTNMVITQRAYSSSVNAFTTVNEMVQDAISILS